MIKSIFGYAEFLQDKNERQGIFDVPHEDLLRKSAFELVQGYPSLEEAQDEQLTRFNGYGLEIEASAIQDAVGYWIDKGFPLHSRITDKGIDSKPLKS